MRIVLRIGGSVVASPLNPDLINQYVELLKELKKKGHNIGVVVGGGAYAREFIKAAESLGLNQETQDEVAISVSRIFAQLFLKKLGKSGCQHVPLTINDAAKCLAEGKITVMGGLRPGMTTDTVAALIVKETNAEILVKGTDQEGVFDKDPRKHADAVKLERLSIADLSDVCAENRHKAGIHQIIDPEAIKILKRTRVKVVIVNGFKPENVRAAVKGEKVGTIIN